MLSRVITASLTLPLALAAGCLRFTECTVDEDCVGGDVCAAGVCVECEDNDDCGDGEACNDNACVAAQGAEADQGGGAPGCQGDEDCDGGVCDLESGECVDATGGENVCCAQSDAGPTGFACEDPGSVTACEEAARIGDFEAVATLGCVESDAAQAACR